MKKTLRAFAAISALALLFGFASCQTGDEEPISQNTPTVDPIAMNGKAYNTIKEAFAAIPSESTDTYKIVVQPGTYSEIYINYNGAATVQLTGNTSKQYGTDVIITGRGNNMGQERGRELLEFQGTGNLILENVTLLSDLSRKDVKGDAQAEVLGFDSTGTVAAYNCSFKSHQDTMRTTGKGWFYKCYVEGDTDFIWMESAGVVALYEECEIVSVYDEFASTHASYILAPRASVANTMGKGAVIYKSNIKLLNDSNFLFRNPWGTNKDYYNQGAFVDCNITVAEGKVFEPTLAKSAAMGTDDQQYVGWKIDSVSVTDSTGKLPSIGVISDEVKENEYSGRNTILNRFYSVKFGKFMQDPSTRWDVKALASKLNWTVTEDTSKDLLEGETASEVVTYNFTTAETPEGVICTGFANEAGKAHFVGQNGATIEIPVTGKAIVSVTGYYKGNGNITAGTQGEAAYNFNNGSTSKFLTEDYVVYQADAGKVIISATETSYITQVVVTYDNDITFIPVTSIEVSTADNLESIAGKKSLQFSAVVTPENATNNEYSWSVDNTAAATIDATGLLTAENVETEQTVVVTATAKDENKVSASKTITIIPASANAVEFNWFSDSTELTGTSSNAEIATVADAVTQGTWIVNTSKFSGDVAGVNGLVCSSGDEDTDRDEIYIEYPITAVVPMKLSDITVRYANTGTNNGRAYITYYKNADEKVVISDDNKTVVRSNKISYPMNIVLAAGDTVKIRVSIHGHLYDNALNDGTEKIQSFVGKTPGMGGIVITGEAGNFPVPGTTYEYNFCSSELEGKTSTSDELVSWKTAASTNHGIANGSLEVLVAGNVKVSLGLCQYGNDTKYVIKNGETEVASIVIAAGQMTACYSKGVTPSWTDANSVSFNYTGDPTTLTISGLKYMEGLKVEPIVQ